MKVEIQDIRKRFGQVEALRGISLSIPSGGRVGLVGPNGSGKSTLIRALMGMVRVEGQIRLNGMDPHRDFKTLRPAIAYVPQIPPQFSFTVGEMLTAVKLLRGLKGSEIEACALRLNLDLPAIAAKAVKELSGGMKQKLSLAISLSARSSLLILDEPTASLDSDGRERFFNLMNRDHAGATLILSSHRQEEIRQLVDEVVVLEDGEIRLQAPARDYLQRQNMSVVEIHAPRAGVSNWLAENGFAAGLGGHWTRTIPRAESATLVSKAFAHLNGTIDGLVLRDLDRLEIHARERAPQDETT